MQKKRVSLTQDDYFQSMQKQSTLQTINFIPIKAFSNQIAKTHKKNEEDLIWKIKTMENGSNGKKPQYRFSKNISFEDQDKMSSYDESYDDQEPHVSSLASHYQSLEQVYRKKITLGTSWIGRRQYFASTFVNPSNIQKGNVPYYCQKQPEETKILAFDANFQSGNLFSAFKINSYEYDLLLQNDINTKGNTQWFYFRITNAPKNTNIKINIVNMRKSDSLFNYGMMPCIYSQQDNRKTNRGWFRGGKQIKYFKNDHQIQNSRRFYYTLTFTISTIYQNDVLKIAQSYPYTYSNLNTYLDSLQQTKYKKELYERQTILNTIGKNKIQALTIKQYNNKIKARPFIIVIARQHPGQTPASFICEGLIDFLLSKEKQAEFIRKNYQIKIMPMINPDGVCAGNYRTNLYGFDLNRRWDGSKIKNLHEAAYIKKYMAQITKGREIAFILDLHGHSRKMFSFFYGNPNPNNPADVRIFPLLCSKLLPNYIKFQDCTFTSDQYKRNTARVQFGLAFKSVNIFTFQASFFGYCGKDKIKKHFTVEDYKQLGIALGRGIYIHEKGKQIYSSNPDHKEISLYKKCFNQLRNSMILISLGEKVNSGSQSSPEQCQLKENQGQKLQASEQYSKDNRLPSKNVKIVKKTIKRQLVKFPTRSERQMQVLDIAQVNSMLPNNVLALFPSSFLAKKRKAETFEKSTQTDSTPLIKVYQTCKNPQNIFINESSLHLKSEINTYQSKSSILAKTNIIARHESREKLFSAGFNRINTAKKNKQARSTTQKATHKKVSSYSANKGMVSKEAQTILSLSCMFSSQIKSKIDKEIAILELKNIDPSFTSFNFSRHREANFIEKNSSTNMFQNIKIRKRQQI